MTAGSRRALVLTAWLLTATALAPLAWVRAGGNDAGGNDAAGSGPETTATTTTTTTRTTASPATTQQAPAVAAALAEGAELYHDNCSVCHGPTGGGLAEARLAFPPTDRNCSRCHKANNPVVMPLTNPIIDNEMFPIGDPPALHPLADEHAAGRGARGAPMPATAAPATLFAYVKATMPRYHPGRQTDEEYWLITAHLLQLNGRSEEAAVAVSEASEAGHAWSD